MKITEVYFRSSDKKPGQQWFEVFNDSLEAVNLRNALVKRMDGQKKHQAWAIFLPDEDSIVEPGQYAIIAQRVDLGQNLCSQHRVIVLKDPNFAFKSSGVQTLCVAVAGESESCARISDSKKIEDGFSRVPLAGLWVNELCEMKPGFFASPGLQTVYCQKNIESGWTACPESVVEAAAIAQAAGQVVAQTGTVRQTIRHSSSGCRLVPGVSNVGLEFTGLMLVLLMIVKLMRNLHNDNT